MQNELFCVYMTTVRSKDVWFFLFKNSFHVSCHSIRFFEKIYSFVDVSVSTIFLSSILALSLGFLVM